MKAEKFSLRQNIQRIKTFLDQIADMGLNTLFVKFKCMNLLNTLSKREIIYEKNSFLFDYNVNIVHAFLWMQWRQ